MLQKKLKKDGWFVGRGYRHFDHPLSYVTAKKMVTSETRVSKHSFRPLISYEKIERRFKGFDELGRPVVKHKSRLICYASHRDSQIYAYYAHNLEQAYGELRKKVGIDDCVLAYRAGKGSNIHMAQAVFAEIKKRSSSTVMAFDISGFFDHLDHKILKQNWCRVIGKSILPDDHYNIFRSVSRFSRVDKAACLKALNIEERALKNSTQSLCNDDEFHKKICGRQSGFDNLIKTNSAGRDAERRILWNEYGIPQGTPISAVLSNIFMLDFDIYMNDFISNKGGIYLRYSDDILVICPIDQYEIIEKETYMMIEKQGAELKINKSKTEVSRFETNAQGQLLCSGRKKDGTWTRSAVQYLGFKFDGERITLRHPTLARYQRKVKYAVRNARRTAKYFKKDKIRSRKLYLDLTDIGARSMPSYAKRAAKIMGDKSIIKQLSTHRKKLKDLLEIENSKLN